MFTPPRSLVTLSAELEALLFRFEDAWNSGPPPDLRAFCPPQPEPEYLLELCRIDMERRRAADLPIDVQAYLTALPELTAQDEFAQKLTGIASDLNPTVRLNADSHAEQVEAPANAGSAAISTNSRTITVTAVYEDLQGHARGGLGEIFVADDVRLRRRVALKTLQQQWRDNRRAQRDFLQEVEVTSRLEHPGIVPVHGLGQTADGRPCYSMRFVEGETLRAAIQRFHHEPFAEEGQRAVAFRGLLARLVAVCNTLAYAHSRNVLHRDLKPDNIMLGPFGETLVLDWGMSKRLHAADGTRRPDDAATPASKAAADTVLVEGATGPERDHQPRGQTFSTPVAADATQMGDLVGTPAYMSPEQAVGDLDQIGPRTDVFGLGATLYSILTGVPPYQEASLAFTLAKARAGDFVPPRQRVPDVPAALEAICCQAMSINPQQRYASALDMAGDVENWLAGERVSAWKEPWHAGLRRYARRRRALVAVLAALAVVLPLSAGIGSWLVGQERAQREIADRDALAQKQIAEVEAATATQIAEYLQRTFQSADPLALDAEGFHGAGERAQQDTLLRMLDSGVELLRDRFHDQPLLRADLLDALGNSYRSLGQWEKARSLLDEGHELRLEHLGGSAAETLASRHSLARWAHDKGEYTEAERIYREVIRGREQLDPPQPLLVAQTKYHFAWMLFNRPLSLDTPQFDGNILNEAEQALQDVLRTRQERLPANHRDIGLAWAALAAVKSCQGEQAAMQNYMGLAVELFGKIDQENWLGQIMLEYMRAEQFRHRREFDKADASYQVILKGARQHLGPRHPLVVIHMGNMIGMYRAQGDLKKAEPYIREAQEIVRGLPAMRSLPVVIDALLQYGDYLRPTREEEAKALYAEALGFARERLQENGKYILALEQRLME